MLDTEDEPAHGDGSAWTVAALEVFLVKLINERDRAYQQRWEASEKATGAALTAAKEAVAAALLAQKEAVSKAEMATEKRFDAVGEAHAALTEQAATFLPRAEFDRTLRSLSDKLDILTMTLADKTEAAAKGFESRLDAISHAFEAKTEANALKIDNNNKSFGARLDDLRAFKDTTKGRSDGLNSGWVYLLGLVSLVNGLVALFLIFRHSA